MLTVLGNPENRRVHGFVEAARSRGLDPQVLAWADLLRGAAPPDKGWIRIDSPGEDATVRRLLLEAGASRVDVPLPRARLDALTSDTTRIGGSRQAHLGLVAALERLDPGRCVPSPAAIATLGDKRACSAHLAAAGVPVPPSLPEVRTSDEAFALLRAHRRVFLKPRHGSSASGVLAWETNGARHKVTTSVEVTDDGLHNSLRVRRYRDPATIRRIVDALAPDGLHAERWVPKAGLDGRTFDLRVVVIDGRAEHVVVRTATGPLTNLHLGNARGDVDAVRRALGEAAWTAGLDVAIAAAAAFDGLPWCGVDLLAKAHGGWAVCEVNAFGDLVPGVRDRAGRSTWEAEADWLAARL